MKQKAFLALVAITYTMTVLTIAILVTSLVGCSTVADYVQARIPDLVEPEVIEFELTVDGEVIQCVGVYLEMDWSDGSVSPWLWASKRSDKRCEAEMERLAKDEDG